MNISKCSGDKTVPLKYLLLYLFATAPIHDGNRISDCQLPFFFPVSAVFLNTPCLATTVYLTTSRATISSCCPQTSRTTSANSVASTSSVRATSIFTWPPHTGWAAKNISATSAEKSSRRQETSPITRNRYRRVTPYGQS